jgi:hypothetical protein
MTIEPGEFNDFEIRTGQTWSYTLTWTDSTGALVNLTGYSATMKAKADPNDTTAIFTLTSGSGITLGGVAGTIIIALSATETAALLSGVYYYDLLLTSGGSTKDYLIYGTLSVVKMVSA